MSKAKWFLAAVVTTVLVSLLVTSCAPAATPTASPTTPEEEVIEWDVSMWGPLGSRVWPIQWYKEEMEKRTEGRMKVILHMGAELSPPKEMLDGLKAGLYEMAHFAAGYHPGKTPLCRVAQLPCMEPRGVENIARWEYALMKNPHLEELMEKRWNSMYVGLSHARPQYTFMGVKPVRTVEDLDGQRIRVGGKIGELLADFGASPVSMPAPEIYEALARGILDQSYLAPTSQAGYKIPEISDYYTYNLGLGYGFFWAFAANKDAFEGLPQDIKDIHWKVAKELMFERLPTEHKAKRQELEEKWKEMGIEFIDFPPQEREKLAEKAEFYWNDWAEEMEADGLPGKDVLQYALDKRKEIAGY